MGKMMNIKRMEELLGHGYDFTKIADIVKNETELPLVSFILCGQEKFIVPGVGTVDVSRRFVSIHDGGYDGTWAMEDNDEAKGLAYVIAALMASRVPIIEVSRKLCRYDVRCR